MDAVATFVLIGVQPWAHLMVQSVKSVLKCPVIQLSDLKTPQVAGTDEVVRLPMKIPLMLYRLKHLAQCPYSKWVTFDTDIIVKRDLDDVWDRSFDVCLTQRMEGKCLDPNGVDIAPRMPFNTGVMLSREPQFWREAQAWLRLQPTTYLHWWGDQLAVAEIAGRDTYHVLNLPGKEFNWSPTTKEETSTARVVHYKGQNRKAWMLDAASLS